MRLQIAFAVVITGIQSSAVQAQPGPDSWYKPQLSAEEFERCVDALGFQSQPDELIFRVLYKDLSEAYKYHGATARARLRDVEEARAAYLVANPQAHSPWMNEGKDFGLHSVLYGWRTERLKLERQFENDVLLMLQPRQQELWLQMTRQSRRQRVLPEVRRRGTIRSSADLISILESFELAKTESDSLRSICNDYIAVLDAELKEWENEVDAIQAEILALAKDMHGERGTQARERGLQLRAKIDRRATTIANTNVQYAAQIASHLSENVQRFIDEVMRVEYPSVFLPSPVDLAVERLRRIDSLTADQKVAIEDLYAFYCSQRIPLRRGIIRGLLRWEDPGSAELERRVALYSQYLNEGRDPWLARQDHPAMKWFEKRRSLAKTTCARLRGIFPDNEFDSLPMSIQIILSW